MIQNRLLPWAMYRDGVVYINSEIVNELKPIVGDIGGLKSVAELLGWEYKNMKIEKSSVKKVAIVSFTDFTKFLKEEIKPEEEPEKNQN